MKKKTFIALLTSLIMSLTVFSLTGCGGGDEESSDAPAVKCYNGTFTGMVEDNGVYSYKGIPYAQSPTGDLKWLAPQAVEESDESYDAKEFGWTSLQTEWHSEPASTVNAKKTESGEEHNSGEDCLTLNVWTSDTETADKPVMVYFHGGGFGWGGSSDPLYSGKYIVEEHNDVVVISCNYRVGTMGFIDLRGVEGYTDKYKEATDLGLLDAMQSMRWIKQNVEAFGGDPDNITIFGESAGGNLVSCMLVADTNGNGTPDVDEENLFNRCIAHSGSLNLTYTYEEFETNGTAAALCEAVANLRDDDDLKSAEDVTMDDLLALTEDEMYQVNNDPELVDLDGSAVGDVYNMPLRGDYSDGSTGVLPEDPFRALRDGAAANVDLIVGTNQDEWRYWTSEVYWEPILDLSEEDLMLNLGDYAEFIVLPKIDEAKAAAKAAGNAEAEAAVDKIIEMQTRDLEYKDTDDGVTGRDGTETDGKYMWAATELANETGFRAPSIATAAAHADYCASDDKAKGKTYMYYFAKESDNFPWVGACHASELAYVFHNLDETIFSGTVDEGLADQMCEAWVNFAKSGDPSIADVQWTTYDTTDRNTMTMDMDDDNAMKMVSDPLSEERELMEPFAYYYLK
ncbi:MAG: carboxylesterase/lipase family protein [Lentihominibacter sp.]